MDFINDYSDQRHKAWCIHCGASLISTRTNRDHIPTKTILYSPFPQNLPVVEVCMDCNESFSLDEQYTVAFLSSVVTGSVEPDRQQNPHARKILAQNETLKKRIELGKSEYVSQGGETRVVWKPEQERINHVVVKNARGHAYYELGEPMLDVPLHSWSLPMEALSSEERAAFEEVSWGSIWPEVGSRMMTRLMNGHDLQSSWIAVQDSVYRYAVLQADGGILVRTVIYEYLATEVFWK
jgi:hypothetical protein